MKKGFVALLLCLSIVLPLTACGSGITQEQYDQLVSEKEDVEKQLEQAQKDLQALQGEYDEYKEKMKPFEEMTAAQAEAEKAKAEQEKAQIEEEEAAKKAAEEEEAARIAEEERLAREEEEAKGYETGITYDELARTPDDFKGKKVKFDGKVVQVMEGDGKVQIRLAVDDDYDTILYCEYNSDIVSSRVLEDDEITIYGVSAGLLTYQSTMGGNITIPAVLVEKIDQ